MAAVITLNLDEPTTEMIDREAAATGQTREQVAADLLRRRLLAEQLRSLQAEVEPYAKKAGITEDDILRDVS